MKRILISTFAAMVLLTSSLFAQRTHDQLEFPEINRFNMPDVITFELRNGIKVYLVEDTELPLINLSMIVRAGSFMDPADKVGLASFTGQLIRGGGSTNYPYETLNELLESRAASMETSFGLTSGSARMNVLKEDFDRFLPVFIDLVRNPAFPDNRIETVKTQQRSAIGRRNDDASSVAAREFRNLIYGNNSVFSRGVEYASIDAITKEDMQAFHQQVMVGRNMYLAVIGDFNARDMRRKIEQAFGTIPAGTANQLNLPKVNYEFNPGINFVAKNDVNQSTIYIGHIGGRRMNPDYTALQLMNEILSGGFSGRLMQEIRTNQGLAYGVGGSYQSNALYDGTFVIQLGTASQNTARAVQATVEEVRKLQQNGVTQQELDDAKDRILNSLVFRYTSRASVLNERINNEYNGLPADIFNRYIDEVGRTTVEDVNRVARQYLRPDALQVLIVGNENEMGDQLPSLGDINHIDITIPRPQAARAELPAGDVAEGRMYLNKMAATLLPGGSEFSKVVYDGKVAMGGMTLDSKITMEFPGKLVQELNTPQGQITVVYDNGTGVMRMGPNEQPLPPMQVEGLKNELDRHYLSIARSASDIEVEFTGMDDAGHAMLYLPELNMTIYVNAETGFLSKLTVKEFNPMAGAEIEAVTTYGDWTLSGGVYMAYTAESVANGTPAGKATISSHTTE